MHFQSYSFIMQGVKRDYLELLKEQLQFFPCVAVLGPRQCGKTTLVQSMEGSWNYYDMERGADFSVASEDPDLFFRLNPDRVVVDEAQLLPALFPALRVAIDADRGRKGRFVITGSSSPDLLRSVSESLAGRIAVIEMSPLMWAEVQPSEAPSFLMKLAGGERDPRVLLEGLHPRGNLHDAHAYWLRGGYPEPWIMQDSLFSERWTDQYILSYVERDVARLFPGLDSQRFRQYIRLLAGLSGDVLNYSEVARALGVSQPTARDYFEIAHGSFLWRQVPAYHHHSVKRLVKHPKGYLRDSGLLHRLLHIRDRDTLLAHPRAGASWEGMVIEEILRQFTCGGFRVEPSFFRTGAGAEVDLVCEGAFGRIPFEIKHGQRVDSRDLRAIRDFMDEQNCPLGIVIHNDERPRLYMDNLLGIPFTYL